jgi:hypothetical protein
MRPRQLHQRLDQNTMAFLQDLFAPDHVPSVTDPSTGQHVVDVRKVSEKLGLDPK